MAENTQIVEYESNGEMVKISPTMIKRYLVSGGGNVSDGEVMMFMSLCRYQHLNVYTRTTSYVTVHADTQILVYTVRTKPKNRR